MNNCYQQWLENRQRSSQASWRNRKGYFYVYALLAKAIAQVLLQLCLFKRDEAPLSKDNSIHTDSICGT